MTNSETLQVRFPPDMLDALRRMASIRRVSMAVILRELAQEALRRHEAGELQIGLPK